MNNIAKLSEVDARVRDILMQHYKCAGEKPKQAEDAEGAGYYAWALLGVDVATRIANVFLAIKNPQDSRTYRAICDLTYQLNTNEFWAKNATILLPAIHVALNTYRDGADLSTRRKELGEYSTFDSLIAASRCAPLEIFPLIAYLIGGPMLMVESSVPLKLDLSPYFVD